MSQQTSGLFQVSTNQGSLNSQFTITQIQQTVTITVDTVTLLDSNFTQFNCTNINRVSRFETKANLPSEIVSPSSNLFEIRINNIYVAGMILVNDITGNLNSIEVFTSPPVLPDEMIEAGLANTSVGSLKTFDTTEIKSLYLRVPGPLPVTPPVPSDFISVIFESNSNKNRVIIEVPSEIPPATYEIWSQYDFTSNFYYSLGTFTINFYNQNVISGPFNTILEITTNDPTVFPYINLYSSSNGDYYWIASRTQVGNTFTYTATIDEMPDPNISNPANTVPPLFYYETYLAYNNDEGYQRVSNFEITATPEPSPTTPISPTTIQQNQNVTLNGTNLDTVTRVELIGSSFFVNIISSSPTSLVIDTSGVPPGTYQVYVYSQNVAVLFGTLIILGNTIICFKEDTKIACLKDNMETDIFIQNLKSGDLVKTYNHGYLPVNVVGRNICYNPKNAQRLKSRLFKLKKEKYPSLKEDLIVTGCHSILESTISQSKGEELMDINKRIYTTDELIRLPAYLDDRSDPYVDECGDINVYHVALGNDEGRNYGIYANGLLVESCFIPRIKNEMKIIS
jgi:hypothetical protein